MPIFLNECSTTYMPKCFDYLFKVRTLKKYHYYVSTTKANLIFWITWRRMVRKEIDSFLGNFFATTVGSCLFIIFYILFSWIIETLDLSPICHLWLCLHRDLSLKCWTYKSSTILSSFSCLVVIFLACYSFLFIYLLFSFQKHLSLSTVCQTFC